MIESEINIAIAQACGWKRATRPTALGFWIRPDGRHDDVPHYCTDLNAMAAAIATLTDSEEIEFDANLEIVMQRDEGNGWFAWQPKACQLAEAFLKTKEIEE